MPTAPLHSPARMDIQQALANATFVVQDLETGMLLIYGTNIANGPRVFVGNAAEDTWLRSTHLFVEVLHCRQGCRLFQGCNISPTTTAGYDRAVEIILDGYPKKPLPDSPESLLKNS